MSKLILITFLWLLKSITIFSQVDGTGETELYELLSKVDKELNSTYKQTMKQLNLSDRNKLKSLQRAWIKDRDKECNVNEGGGVVENK